MTGTGFDGLVVNHGGLDEVSDQLLQMVKRIDDRMNGLESDLGPLRAQWSGTAHGAYVVAKNKWDTSIAEMMNLLNETARSVAQANQDYRSADLEGAQSFQIG